MSVNTIANHTPVKITINQITVLKQEHSSDNEVLSKITLDNEQINTTLNKTPVYETVNNVSEKIDNRVANANKNQQISEKRRGKVHRGNK